MHVCETCGKLLYLGETNCCEANVYHSSPARCNSRHVFAQRRIRARRILIEETRYIWTTN